MIVVKPSEQYTFRQSVKFDEHQYGSDTGIPSGTYYVRRGDGQYWNGSTFQVEFIELATTIVNDIYSEFTYTFPASEDLVFSICMRVNNDPTTEINFHVVTRTSSGGGGGDSTPTFDAVDFVAGIPFK